jgi:thiol-disulfide isomerase/thioredoxin
MLQKPSIRAAAVLLAGGACWLLLSGLSAAAEGKPRSTLHLIDDGFVSGELCDSGANRSLRWQSPLFAKPLDFPVNAIKAVEYEVIGKPPAPVGEFCFELVNNDFVYGNLVELTDATVVVSSARLGKVVLRRPQVQRIYRYAGADSIYLGPNGLTGWKENSTAAQWRDDGGQLQTDQMGATLEGDLGIPEKAMITLELSWQRKPDFVLTLGTDNGDATKSHGIHFEVWDDDLVAVAEAAREADVASLKKIAPGPDRIRIQAYFDQAQGRLILLSPGGKALATLNTHNKKAIIYPGLRIRNGRGDLRLEYLRVSRWNGQTPREAREDQPRLHRTDGSIAYGAIESYDLKAKQFTLRDGSSTATVAQAALADLYLMPQAAAAKAGAGSDKKANRASGPAAGEDLEGIVRVALRDGQRCSGVLSRVENAQVMLTCAGVVGPLRFPLADIRMITVPRPGEVPSQGPTGKSGRLEIEGLVLKGWLVDGSESAKASCLVWQPDVGLNAAPLVPGLSGRIVYRDSPPLVAVRSSDAVADLQAIQAKVIVLRGQRQELQKAVANAKPAKGANAAARVQQERTIKEAQAVEQALVQQVQALQLAQVALRQNGRVRQPQAPPAWALPSGGKPALHLRSGDTIPCEVTGMDEKGVFIKTPDLDATFVAHDKLKSVELLASWDSSQIDEVKRNRLLTLPRLQKDSPPTHLICSKNGDFLRGRIVSMDDNELKVEVRLETKTLPRDRVAQIIWLHADELTGKPAAASADSAGPKTRVQTIRPNGDRLTFIAEKADRKQISGKSDILGPCHVALADVDQVLFGGFIEQSAALLAYHLWKLHHATDPVFAQGDENAPRPANVTGLESPLVGKPAFAFNLDMLDGSKYHLADHKGKIVVLDFWATWCGPCMQAMPVTEELVRNFADRQVELVAVNLEEQPNTIKSVLERHKLKIPVALDRDGVVAARYAVNAIPQTVLIDREGNVARLFIGGGKNAADALREAIKELVENKASPKAAK